MFQVTLQNVRFAWLTTLESPRRKGWTRSSHQKQDMNHVNWYSINLLKIFPDKELEQFGISKKRFCFFLKNGVWKDHSTILEDINYIRIKHCWSNLHQRYNFYYKIYLNNYSLQFGTEFIKIWSIWKKINVWNLNEMENHQKFNLLYLITNYH